MLFRSIATAGGLVYLVLPGDRLAAFSAADGAEVWRYTEGDRVTGGPAVAGGGVYFTDNGGWLCALDALTGDGPALEDE